MSVSVIIPTYNRAELVQKTLDSVFDQIYKDYEIIVIDDGSTDDTESQLKRYGNKIKYIKQENRGLNAARNHALDIADGDYIALLDSDDLWLNFKLQLETEILEKYKHAGFVFSDFFILKPDGQKIPHGLHTWYSEPPIWHDIYSDKLKFKLSNNIISKGTSRSEIDLYFGNIYHESIFGPRVLPSASLFRRSMVNGVLDFNENDSSCGDWEFYAKLSNLHGAIFIDMETALNRSHEDEVRLTRVDHTIQISRRLAMIERIWVHDENYYINHKNAIDSERIRLYQELLKLQIFNGQSSSAKNTINKIDNIDGNLVNKKLGIYRILVRIPGSSVIIKILRRIKQLLL